MKIRLSVTNAADFDSSCVLCGKYVSFNERHFFRDPKSKGFLHWACANAIKKGYYKFNKKLNKYERR